MGKISIQPKEYVQINTGSGYEYFSAVCDSNSCYDIGNNTNVQLRVKLSNVCINNVCTYDLYSQSTMTNEQRDIMYRTYVVNYYDDNNCRSDGKFDFLCGQYFVRPIDEVTSDHPKEIKKSGSSLKYQKWWKGETSATTTYYWDKDSAFATVSGDTACQGIDNGFALSEECFIEFYSGTTDVVDAGRRAVNIPWDTINWQRVPDIKDWWVHPVSLSSSTQELASSEHMTDITGGTNGCYGYWNHNNDVILPNARSALWYAADKYEGGADAVYRLGKVVVKLKNTICPYFSLGGVENSSGITAIIAESYTITNWNDTSFTATSNVSSVVDPETHETVQLEPVISGATIHYMSPVEVYFYQKTESQITVVYRYTVYSDVEGATVTWSGGATGTATIIHGYTYVTNTTGTSVKATLSKTGVSFLNNGATIAKNASVTINEYKE